MKTFRVILKYRRSTLPSIFRNQGSRFRKLEDAIWKFLVFTLCPNMHSLSRTMTVHVSFFCPDIPKSMSYRRQLVRATRRWVKRVSAVPTKVLLIEQQIVSLLASTTETHLIIECVPVLSSSCKPCRLLKFEWQLWKLGSRLGGRAPTFILTSCGPQAAAATSWL